MEMTTEKQKSANQANAKKSTGPKSKAGKMVSRRNALTHGLTGEIIFHPGESPDEYRKLRREYHQEFKPFGRYETELVERLVVIDWRLRRVLNFETLLVGAPGYRYDLDTLPRKERTHEALARGLSEALDHDHFEKLGRYEQRLIRLRKRTLAELEVRAEAPINPRPAPITIEHKEDAIEHGEGLPTSVKEEE
jgi:hypothetical protein